MNIQHYLNDTITSTMRLVGAPEGSHAAVKLSSKPQFGDYQANGIMGAAKKMGTNPRALAEQVVNQLNLGDRVEKLEIAGPGFINIWLSATWLTQQAQKILASERLDVAVSDPSERIVVDYSSPNVAKEMHIGHIRCNCIGDAVVRTLEFLGHTVIRANHIGDWGTQFGMLIAHLEEVLAADTSKQAEELKHLEVFYRDSKKHFDEDPAFAERARNYVVKLQQGDPWCLSMWQKLVDVTMAQNQKAYDRMNISLSAKDTMGESMYNDQLPGVLETLKAKGLAKEDQGAWIVQLDEFKNKEGDALGIIVKKRDGGFLYTTTDIAAAQYRVNTLKANRILIFTDSRQSQHMQQLSAICRKSGIIPDNVRFEHHPFGMVLGKDGRPFKTRSGDTVKLMDVLDEADERALTMLQERQPDMDDSQQQQIAKVLAMASVKYAELSKHRLSDYVFDWESMLSFEGNTAPYLLYAYSRIQSIFRKASVELEQIKGPINISEPQERALMVTLNQFNETLESVSREALPHLLCAYLYELAGKFMGFYEHCPINKEGITAVQKQSRLAISALVSRTLKQGLSLLGIETLDRM
jgi:arginyl-tRNA synthetase